MWPKLTGIMPVGNVIRTHYPFLESAIASLSLVDRLIIADGGSEDGTYEFLLRLADAYPKVEVVQHPHWQSACWECIDRSTEQMYQMVEDGWVYVVQADEFISPKDYYDMRVTLTRADAEGYNGIRQRQRPFDWKHYPDAGFYHYWTMRFVRAGLQMRSGAGADSWILNDEQVPAGYTTNSVPPELKTDILFYNFFHVVPAAALKYGQHVEFYNTGDKGCRRNSFEHYTAHPEPVIEPTQIALDMLPPVFRGLAGRERYEVRSELFDPTKWT